MFQTTQRRLTTITVMETTFCPCFSLFSFLKSGITDYCPSIMSLEMLLTHTFMFADFMMQINQKIKRLKTAFTLFSFDLNYKNGKEKYKKKPRGLIELMETPKVYAA